MNCYSMNCPFLFKAFFVYYLSMGLISCASKTTYEKMIIKTVTGAIQEELIKYNAIIIIPSSGCSGCLTKAESFFLSHHEQDNYLFIFTGFYSDKTLSIRLGGSEYIRKNNVILDEDGLFYLSDYQDVIYPYRLQVKDGVIVKAKPLS